MRRNHVGLLALLFCLSFFPLAFLAVDPARAQVGANARNDLWGDNMGDYIVLWWTDESSATQYVVYRSTSQNGPWQQSGTVDADMSRTGGGKIDRNPDARLMTLCYKVEAQNAAGTVIKTYEPICVPKYAEKK
jgi:hypothetical protein